MITLRAYSVAACLAGACFSLRAATDNADEFSRSIRPVLAQNCLACHNPANPKNRVDFLKAATAQDLEKNRTIWRSVAAQLRNRTMPPIASKLTEQDRLYISTWVTNRLRATACNSGASAGPAMIRRLTRREYRDTIRDLLGIDYDVTSILPADGTGGEGFDTNAQTLYVPPIALERYLEAAQQILDRVIAAPGLNRLFPAASMQPRSVETKPVRRLGPGEELSATLPIYVEDSYDLRVRVDRPKDRPFQMEVKVDDAPAGSITFQKDKGGGPTVRSQSFRFSPGTHTVTVKNMDYPVNMYALTVEQKQGEPSPEKRASHYRLFGVEPGQRPVEPRKAAALILSQFVRKAYRRPVERAEVDALMKLYDRAAERGDPYEQCVKLPLKAVLVSPKFLFRAEEGHRGPGIHPLGQYELASRLSYFLWSTMPDEELFRLAQEGRLQDSKVLAGQIERMLDNPRSRSFAEAFVGQWLGTQDVGGRVVPLLTELQNFYTPEVAADLREQPVLLFHDIITADRSLLDLIDGEYTFLNERLVRFYQLENVISGIDGDLFQRVKWPGKRRGGLLGLGAVLAMSSHYKQTSPILRGAWVLDALLGTPVPPPPPDIPPLEAAAPAHAASTVRQKVERHRADPTCSACHRIMDPIGFGLENFDWMGRWRDREENGLAIDASGVLPSGERFDGPVELRRVLLERKEEFLRHITSKVLGYALGRSLGDADQCAVQRIVDNLETNNYGGRNLIREIALSVPFRNSEGGARVSEPDPGPRRRVRKTPEQK